MRIQSEGKKLKTKIRVTVRIGRIDKIRFQIWIVSPKYCSSREKFNGISDGRL
jgi:hypothetical protein